MTHTSDTTECFFVVTHDGEDIGVSAEDLDGAYLAMRTLRAEGYDGELSVAVPTENSPIAYLRVGETTTVQASDITRKYRTKVVA